MNTTNANVKQFQSRWSEVIDPQLGTEDISFNFLVPKIATYYRSKAFVSQININPLIAASAPVFFLLEKIKALETAPDIEKLHDDLTHEINAFEHQASTNGYRAYVILAARYVMCSWIDQTIFASPWGKACQWEKLRLTDSQETEKGNPFYLLINRCLREPNIYIDLLELFYLCLSLGFQGTSPHPETSNNKALETRDYLFETIHKQREGISKRLEVAETSEKKSENFVPRALIRLGSILLAVCILTSSYFTLNTYLEAPMGKGETALISSKS